MRYLILFMLLAGIFMFGKRSCHDGSFMFGFGGVRGEGPVRTETRQATDFHAVQVELPGTVEVSISEQYSVEIQAQENILPIIKTAVEDGKLRLYFEKSVSRVEDLKIRISAPAFDAFSLAGSGSLKTLTPIPGDQLKLSIGGSGEITVPQASVNKIDCSIAGSGNIRVGGKATDVDFEIAGSGDIEAKELFAQNGKADIAGSGSVHCNTALTLKVGIAGSGDVYYLGSPTIDMDISGSGKVKKVD